MTSPQTDPADEPLPNEADSLRSPRDEASAKDHFYDDAALREAIARMMADDVDGQPLDDAERQARVAALRQEIENGDYMPDERIGDIVDRLMQKWKL
jgi:anti-sigma28 factor (negative regulator of flagellin synthesis)